MTFAVTVENLEKRFEIWRGDWFNRTKTSVTAVEGISFNVEAGESVAFLGPNGAGKSTTIKMLTGILHPTTGSASVLQLTPWKQREMLAHKMGVVFGQRSQLWYHLPPKDTFELLAHVYELDRRTYRARADMLIERFGIAPFLNTPVRKLSLGQRMRAEIAASLLHRPQILFLDEPTIGLDIVARQELRALIREWNKQEGLTVFLTSHDTGDVANVCDRVLVINHGLLVLDDTLSALQQGYVSSKVMAVKFHDKAPEVTIAGVHITNADDYSLVLEVDTRIAPIETVMAKILQLGSVADVTIEDPPLEEIITHIYSRARTGMSAQQQNTGEPT
jgi:ABC-2 type transport system ATP-binding protein